MSQSRLGYSASSLVTNRMPRRSSRSFSPVKSHFSLSRQTDASFAAFPGNASVSSSLSFSQTPLWESRIFPEDGAPVPVLKKSCCKTTASILCPPSPFSILLSSIHFCPEAGSPSLPKYALLPILLFPSRSAIVLATRRIL